MSRLDLIVGPNGAGKSTLFDRVVAAVRPGLPFVNADRIARERFAGAELEHSYEAARIASKTRAALIEARIDFCTETVFSHPSKVDLVDAAVVAGYSVVMHVVMIPLELSAPRVAARVDAGGHDVPTSKLEPRFVRLWPLVAETVGRCERCVFYDNAIEGGPVEVAAFRFGVADYAAAWPSWTPDVLRTLS